MITNCFSNGAILKSGGKKFGISCPPPPPPVVIICIREPYLLKCFLLTPLPLFSTLFKDGLNVLINFVAALLQVQIPNYIRLVVLPYAGP